jgi:23S rRNA G2069 N7-methylase RlmK/C1962 C5-methylase RlmI
LFLSSLLTSPFLLVLSFLSVTIVESSQTAIQTIQRNLLLNQLPLPPTVYKASDLREFLPSFPSLPPSHLKSDHPSESPAQLPPVTIFQEDVDKYLKTLANLPSTLAFTTPLFDLVICDPPKLAPSTKSLPRAEKKSVSSPSASLTHLADISRSTAK